MSTMMILLQAGGTGSMQLINLAFMLGIFAVFYFFMIRPQAKKQKEQANFINELAKGRDVVTSSGILGRITKIEDDIVTLAVDNKSYIRVTKGAISKDLTESVYSKKSNPVKVDNN